MALVTPAEYLRVLIRVHDRGLAERIKSLDDVHRLQDVTLPGYREADAQLVRASWEQLYEDVRSKRARLFGYPATGVDQVEIGETDKEVGDLDIWKETLHRDGRLIFTHVRFEVRLEESRPKPSARPAEPVVADAVPVQDAPETASKNLPPPGEQPDEPTVAPTPKPGPTPGELKRFDAADRALFDEVDRLMKEGMSRTAATEKLANEGHVAGVGASTPQSRARRLAKLHKAERRS
jgi:hypothetical protein